MIVFRGIFAALFLVATAAFGVYYLVLAPVIEGALIPTKELRADFTGHKLPPDLSWSRNQIPPIDVVVAVSHYY